MHPPHRIIGYSILNWGILILLWGLTQTIAGTSAVPIVLILAHLGIVPMLTHQFLRKSQGDRVNLSWKVGLCFSIIGFLLDGLFFSYYLGLGSSYFGQPTTYLYFALRLTLAPITSRWLEPHLTLPSAG